MFVVVAWFAANPRAARRLQDGLGAVEKSSSALVPDTYARRDFGGDGWGITVWHPEDTGAFRWPMVAKDASLTAISLGIPVGAQMAGGPTGLARRLLDGEDVHDRVVPPFGLIAIDGTDRVVLQQDWLGMCRLFTATSGGVTAFSNRPTLLAELVMREVRPSHAGWESYAIAGHFGGSMSPVAGVRLLDPGERVTCRYTHPRGWTLERDVRFNVDDAVRTGLKIRDAGLDAT